MDAFAQPDKEPLGTLHLQEANLIRISRVQFLKKQGEEDTPINVKVTLDYFSDNTLTAEQAEKDIL